MKTIIQITTLLAFSLLNVSLINDAIKENSIVEVKMINKEIYEKDTILHLMADVMTELVNRVKTHDDFRHGVSENGKTFGFFIYDLVDTTNFSKEGDVSFTNKHIYHFSSINYRYHFSNICYLNDGEIVIFKSLNCDNYGNNIQEVKEYFKQDSLYSNQNHVLLRLDLLDRFSIYFKKSKLTGVKCK